MAFLNPTPSVPAVVGGGLRRKCIDRTTLSGGCRNSLWTSRVASPDQCRNSACTPCQFLDGHLLPDSLASPRVFSRDKPRTEILRVDATIPRHDDPAILDGVSASLESIDPTTGPLTRDLILDRI